MKNRLLILDASAYGWPGSTTYLSNLIHNLLEIQDLDLCVIAHKNSCPFSQLSVIPSNLEIVYIDKYLPFCFGISFIAKHISLFRKSFRSSQTRRDFSILVNTSFAFLPFPDKSTKVWHNSLHLNNVISSLAIIAPKRSLRLLLERIFDSLVFKNIHSHVFPSLFAQNLVFAAYGHHQNSYIVPHSINHLVTQKRSRLFSVELRYHPVCNQLKSTFDLVYVAALESYKNHFLILQCLELLSLEHEIPLIRFHLVGPAVHKPLIRQICKSPYLKTGNLFVYGRIPYLQLSELMLNCDAALALSSTETFGYPIVEALAYSLPLLIYNSECNIELAGNSAIHINNPRDLCSAILMLVRDFSYYSHFRDSSSCRFNYLGNKLSTAFENLLNSLTIYSQP